MQVWQKKKKTNGVEFLLEVISMCKNAQTKEIIKLWLMIQKGTLIVENDTLNFFFYDTDQTL